MWAEIKEENWGYEKKKCEILFFPMFRVVVITEKCRRKGRNYRRNVNLFSIWLRGRFMCVTHIGNIEIHWNLCKRTMFEVANHAKFTRAYSEFLTLTFFVIILLLKIWNLLAVAEDRIECCALSCEFVSRFRLGWYKRLLVLHTVKLRNYTHSIVPELCSMTKHTPDLINLFFSLRIQNIMCVRWR